MLYHGGMSWKRTAIELSTETLETLQKWSRSTTAQHRMVLRARILLLIAEGRSTQAIAKELDVRPSTVSKWRLRFARQGLAGLSDAPRPGAKRVYGPEVEHRILAQLDEPPPKGFVSWNGRLVSEALGDVSCHQVWRVLREHRIGLQRRRSWCLSTDPQFAAKAADIVGLYLDPPENAVVLSVDEKPSIQALERAQGYLRLPNGVAMRGFSHEYKRHGTTTLFAALSVATGQVKAGHYNRRRRVEFLDFMNEVIAQHEGQEIHVILDNLNTHKPKRDQWLATHKNVHFHFTPTHASWLNQVETWFSILSCAALKGASHTSPAEVRSAIDDFIAVYNDRAAPFEWRKAVVHPVPLKKHIADLRK